MPRKRRRRRGGGGTPSFTTYVAQFNFTVEYKKDKDIPIKALFIPDKRPWRITRVLVDVTSIGNVSVFQFGIVDPAESGTVEIASKTILVPLNASKQLVLVPPVGNFWPPSVSDAVNCIQMRSACLNLDTQVSEHKVVGTAYVTVKLGAEYNPAGCNPNIY